MINTYFYIFKDEYACQFGEALNVQVYCSPAPVVLHFLGRSTNTGRDPLDRLNQRF